MKKLSIIKTNPDWLEATWSEEIITQVEVATVILHCESFSGHQEHIAMLEAKCLEFGTELDSKQKEIVKAIQEAFVPTPQEELDKQELKQKIQEANWYLTNTDWVKDYKLRHDLELELIPEDSTKWEVIRKREEYIIFLKRS